MSSLKLFLKDNKKARKTTKYKATQSLQDEKGEAVAWELKPLTTKENEAIREECTRRVPVKGKPNQYTLDVDASQYMRKLIVASVKFPDLYSEELQNSYGVMTPEELVVEMIDNPGEYNELQKFVNEFNGFTDINDKVEEAKN